MPNAVMTAATDRLEDLKQRFHALEDEYGMTAARDRPEGQRLQREIQRLLPEIHALEDAEGAERTKPAALPVRSAGAGRPDASHVTMGGDGRRPGAAGGGTGMMLADAAGNTVRAYASGDALAGDGGPEPGRIGAALQNILKGNGLRSEIIVGSDTDGGFVTPEPTTRRILDLVRAASVAARAGVEFLPVEAGGAAFGTILSSPVAQWRPEGAPVKASGLTFGRIDLRPKTLAAIIPCSQEWAEDCANGAALIENALSQSLAAELDRAILLGDGSDSEPLGLFAHPAVAETGAIGTPTGYGDIVSAVGDILERDYAGDVGDLAWVRNPAVARIYAGLTAADGQPLMPPEWAAGLRTLHTTALPADGGDAGSESAGIVGDFRHVVVGVRTRLNIRVSRDARVTDLAGNVHSAADELKLAFIAYLRADVAVLRPQFFQKLTGITAAA